MTYEWKSTPNGLVLHVEVGGKKYSARVTRPRQLQEWTTYRGRTKVGCGCACWIDQAKAAAERNIQQMAMEDAT